MASRKDNRAGTITKLKDGTYMVSIQMGHKPDGKPNRKSARAKTKTEAKKKLEDLRTQLEDAVYKTTKDFDSLTVKDYFEKFLTYKFATLKPTSYDRLESTVNNYIISNCGHIIFKDLSHGHIQKIINDAKKEGKSYSTIKKIYDAFSGCYNYAINIMRDLDSRLNPLGAVVLPPQRDFDKEEMVILTKEQAANFKAEALRKYKTGNYVYRYGPAMIFMLNTGIRVGEMCGLKWSDIDWDEQTVEIARTAVILRDRAEKSGHSANYVVELQNSPKTNSGHRIIPLNNAALESLNILRGIMPETEAGTVIATLKGNIVRDYSMIKELKQIAHGAGIENIGGMHTLRHTYASLLFDNDIDIKVISELLGHASIAITEQTYIHLTKKRKAKAIKTIEI